jgi:2-dehydro-3-deoxyphosphogluconate aldolase/(4S)-4-hydroxy-2-oxoglutarate aldolase
MAAMSAIDAIREARLVAVVRRPADPDAELQRLLDGDVAVVEITLDAPDALDTIARWRDRTTVVAGTVRTEAEAVAAAAAGAEAIVAPVTSEAVVRWCVANGIPVIPGALTPTEVERAWRGGASLVKLFPAAMLGPAYVRALLAPLADVPLVVTGGITVDNAAEFLAAGAVAVGADASRAVELVERVRVAR